MNLHEFSSRSLFTSHGDLEGSLTPLGRETFRELTDVILIPPDLPRFPVVLVAALRALDSFGASLRSPNPVFCLIRKVIDDLNAEISIRLGWVPTSQELAQPLLRRMHNHAPYAAFLAVGVLPDERATNYLIYLGSELACSLATGKVFGRKFANNLRRAISPHLFGGTNPSTIQSNWEKSAAKKLRAAKNLFENDGDPDPSDGVVPARLFDLKAGSELSQKLHYRAPRQRQALLDHHHQSLCQLQSSGAQILYRAQTGDQTAILTMIAFLAGLRLSTTRNMPLATASASDEFVISLNLSDGTLITNVALLTPASAKPPLNSSSFRDATWLCVKPLPKVTTELLRQLATHKPNASTLAELLPDASTQAREKTIPDDRSALKTTTARFLAAAAPVAIGIGVDRLTAALLTNDFSVIPGSKLYYALARRESIWEAANSLFGAFGWGPATPFINGLPVGSHIVPRRRVITDWLGWMTAELQHHTPGRHCGIDRLVQHHNTYARFCASITTWLVAAREAKTLHFTTGNTNPTAAFTSFSDKRVGAYPGQLWVPMCEPLRIQIAYWLTHCLVFERRLNTLGFPSNLPLMEMLDQFNRGDSAPLFFAVDPATHKPRPLGSADLTKWWPESHRFSPDLGRHFWETELREAHVRSSRIDLFMRHITKSVEAHCSTNADTLEQTAGDINRAQVNLLMQLGFHPIPGLSSRHTGNWI